MKGVSLALSENLFTLNQAAPVKSATKKLDIIILHKKS